MSTSDDLEEPAARRRKKKTAEEEPASTWPEKPTPAEREATKRWTTGHLVAMLGVGLGVGVITGYVAGSKSGGSSGSSPASKEATSSRPQASNSGRQAAARLPGVYVPLAAWTPIEGAKVAKVTIVEFSDFQCPHCAKMSAALKEVAAMYPADVSIHARQFPLPSHKGSEPAARAMQAALRQGKAFEMSEVMFANSQKLADGDIVKYATDLGLDVDKFKADWASDEVKNEVASDLQAGKAANIRATPTIFVNGKHFQGRKAEHFKPYIDDEIKAADELLEKGTPLEKVYETRAKANAG